MQRLQAIHALARFARLAADNASSAEALTLLTNTLAEHAGCDGVATFLVDGDQLALTASCNVPDRARALAWDPDDIGAGLGSALVRECDGAYAHSRTLPLVSGGALFGAVVLLWRNHVADVVYDELAEGLVDLAATILGTARNVQRLAATNDELRRSREMLVRSEKLRALGQMAAGVTHDLKNILNPISLHAQLAARANESGDRSTVDECVDGIKIAVLRGVEVTERLRRFSRQTPEGELKTTDVNALAQEAVLLAKPRLSSVAGRLCKLHEEYGAPPAIRVEASEVVSAVLNLLVNAADAMKGRGTITVRTGARDCGAWIAVQDDGPGMSADVQSRVFEPFFTTKGEEGTGLGLAMVYATVSRHGGSLYLESEVGRGATFTLWFPPARG